MKLLVDLKKSFCGSGGALKVRGGLQKPKVSGGPILQTPGNCGFARWMESRTPRLLRLNHGIHQAISSPLAGSHSRLRLDEGVGRSRGSVGTLTSFNYAHAPLAEWPEPVESACGSSMG